MIFTFLPSNDSAGREVRVATSSVKASILVLPWLSDTIISIASGSSLASTYESSSDAESLVVVNVPGQDPLLNASKSLSSSVKILSAVLNFSSNGVGAAAVPPAALRFSEFTVVYSAAA